MFLVVRLIYLVKRSAVMHDTLSVTPLWGDAGGPFIARLGDGVGL